MEAMLKMDGAQGKCGEVEDIPPLLNVCGTTLQYKTKKQIVTATYQVDFKVFPADRFILLGPSGCGKSTLLKAVGGFLSPVSGRIEVNGAVVERPGPDRMMVFQEFDQLLPWKTVIENILFPMITSHKYSPVEALERAELFLNKVNLLKFRDAYPHTLSGGMKQRVAIARGMAMGPAILLMDEPFAALDALTRLKMQQELLQLWDELHFTVLFVTHSIQEAIILGTRILVLSPHPGQVRAEINAHDFSHENQTSDGFKELQQRIHDMLFAEEASQVEVEANGK
ncbi:ABC transporter ATP-binding protein [Acidihalobacter yilgarnensis]|nr:ABC transporter ATP-binding protein [Acidihalobacter yilgarnensis]